MNVLESVTYLEAGYDTHMHESAALIRKQDEAIKQLRAALGMSLRVFINQGWDYDLIAAKKAREALAATEEFK